MNITPIQKLTQMESDLSNMFDSDTRIAMAILEYIRKNKQRLLDEEKSIIQDAFLNGYEYCNQRDLEEQDDDFDYDYYETNFNK